MGQQITRWDKLGSIYRLEIKSNLKDSKLKSIYANYWAEPNNSEFGILCFKIYVSFSNEETNDKFDFEYQTDYAIYPYVDNNDLLNMTNQQGFSKLLNTCWDNLYEHLQKELLLSQTELNEAYIELHKNVLQKRIYYSGDYSLNELK